MIEPGYLHLLINHFPIVLGVMGTLGALVALVMRRRSVWLFAVACLAIAGLFAQPVVMTGEIAEHIMRDAWYMSKAALEEHETSGEWARWALLLSGAASAFAWWILVRTPRTTAQQRDGRTGDFPGWLQALVVVTALLSTAITARTAYLGGVLVHANPTVAFPPTPATPATPVTAPVSSEPPVPADSAAVQSSDTTRPGAQTPR